MNKISIISPLYNEKDNLNQLYLEIIRSMKEMDFEIIFVDDGSNDGSWDIIKEISKKDKRVRGIKLSRNFGQTAAIKAGIENSTGNIIVTIDADLQNDPEDIPVLINYIKSGYDLVNGYRKKRNDNFITRILPSKTANFIISMVTGIKLKDYGCTLKAYKKEILNKIELYGEMHRFIPALCGYAGAKIIEIEVNHRPRIKGKSKYGFLRIYKVILDLMIVKFMGNFITKPVYFFGFFSFLFLLIASIFFLITLYNKWYNNIFVKDQPLFLVAIFMSLVAMQFASIGILAEMLTRIYYSRDKKDYYIEEKTYD